MQFDMLVCGGGGAMSSVGRAGDPPKDFPSDVREKCLRFDATNKQKLPSYQRGNRNKRMTGIGQSGKTRTEIYGQAVVGSPAWPNTKGAMEAVRRTGAR